MTIIAEPEQSSWDLRFRFFGIPVRVHPWFWIVTLIMGSSRDLQGAMVWMAVCFVSILIHEVGHVVAGQAFGERSDVVLYSFGGLAISRYGGRRSAFEQIVISLAGPGAGFLLGGAVALAAYAIGARFQFDLSYWVIPSLYAFLVPSEPGESSYLLYNYASMALNDLLFVNLYWGLVNLMPVYPLDGGQAARAMMTMRDPFRGMRRSLILSVGAGVLMAVVGLLERSIYLAAMFGILAAGSFQLLEGERRRSPPRDSWRR